MININDMHLDRWRTLVNTAITIGFHKRREITWVTEQLRDSEEVLCSMKLVIGLAEHKGSQDIIVLHLQERTAL
jgi:hypothetical protein